MPATGETVLDAAERAGYSLPYSCRKGVCSTCEGALCRGKVSVGSKQFAGPAVGILLCQARPQSDVLIHAKRIERHDPDARKRVTASVYRISRPADDVVILQLRFPAGVRAGLAFEHVARHYSSRLFKEAWSENCLNRAM